MNLHLQEAATSDIPLLLEMIQDYYAFDGLIFHEAAATAALKTLIETPEIGVAFLILSGEKVLGYTILTYGYSIEFHGRTMLLDELYLRPDFREKGLSTRIFPLLDSYCRQKGVQAIRLEVELDNERARAAYRKNRFHEHKRALMTRPLASTLVL